MPDADTYLDEVQAMRPQAEEAAPAETGTYLDELPAEKRPRLPPKWEDVEEQHKKAFPDLDQGMLKQSYEQSRKMATARAVAANSTESRGEYFAKQSIPWVSQGLRAADAIGYSAARNRIRGGEGQDADYQTVAEYERQQEAQRNEGTGEKALRGLAHIPAIAGEFMTGGAALKGATGLLPRTAGWLAPKAAAEGAAVAVPKLIRAGQALTQTAALTATVPSMYVEKWTGDNLKNGRDPLDPKGFAPAFALGMMQTGVLGAIGKAAGQIPGAGVGPWLQRIAAGTGTGMGGQQIVDVTASAVSEVLPDAYKLETGYGILGDALKGKWGDAGEKLFLQGTTFAAFSALHAHHDPGQKAPVLDVLGKSLSDLKAKGWSAEKGAQTLLDVGERMADLLEQNPNLSRDEALKVMEGMPDGPAKRYALALANALSHHGPPTSLRTPGAEPPTPTAPPEPPKPPEPTQGPPQPPAQPAAPPPAEAAKPGVSPLAELSFGQVSELAGAIGAKGKSRAAMQEALEKAFGPKLPEIVDKVLGKTPTAPEPTGQAVPAEPGSGVAEISTEKQQAQEELKAAEKAKEQARHDLWLKTGGKLPPSASQAAEQAGKPEPTTAAPQPEPAAGPRGPADVVREAFGNVKQSQSDPNRSWATVGDATVWVEHDPTRNAVRIDFEREKSKGVQKDVQAGSLALAKGIKRLVKGLRETGATIEYRAIDSNRGKFATERADIYARILKENGYEEAPESGKGGLYSWRPKAESASLPEAKVAPPPEPAKAAEPVAEPAKPAADALAEQARKGKAVHLDEVLDAADLTPIERHVVRERILERSHAEIAEDDAALKKDGTPYTRQRLKQIEARALEKLGLPRDFSLASVNTDAAEGRAVEMMARGERVSLNELQADPKEVARKSKQRMTLREWQEAQFDKLTNEMMKEAENGGELSAERRAYYAATAAEIQAGSGFSQKGKAKPASSPGPDAQGRAEQPAPLRRESAPGVPGGGETARPPNADQGPAGEAAAPHAPGEAAPGGGNEAAPNELASLEQAYRESPEGKRFAKTGKLAVDDRLRDTREDVDSMKSMAEVEAYYDAGTPLGDYARAYARQKQAAIEARGRSNPYAAGPVSAPSRSFEPATFNESHAEPNSLLPERARPRLTPEEAETLREYSRPGGPFFSLNAILRRGGDLGGPSGLAIYNTLQSAFAKTPELDAPVQVYRGVTDPSGEIMAKLKGAMAAGETFTHKGFASTTTNETQPGAGSEVVLKIAAIHGLDARPYAVKPLENEMLLNHDSVYKIKSISESGSGFVVELEQLRHGPASQEKAPESVRGDRPESVSDQPEKASAEASAVSRAQEAPNELAHELAGEGRSQPRHVNAQEAAKLAKQLYDQSQESVKEHNEVVKETRRMLGKYGKLVNLDRYSDPTHVPGFDEAVDHWARRIPEYGEESRLWDSLKEGNRKPLSMKEALEQAREHLSQPTEPPIHEVDEGVYFHRGAAGNPLVPPGKGTRAPTPGVIDSLKASLAPASRGEAAEVGAGALRQRLAEQAQRNVIATEALKKADAHFDNTIVREKDPAVRQARFLEFTDAIENDKINTLPKEIQDFARAIRDANDSAEAELLKRGLLKSTVENYLGHLWKKPGSDMKPEEIGRMLMARRPLAGSEAYKKARTLETYREGIDAGLEPVDWNPARLVKLKLHEVYRSIMAHDVVADLKANGLWEYVRLGKQAPEGWGTINDKLARVFAPGEVKLTEYFDEQQMKGLEKFARGMGIDLARVTRGLGSAAGMSEPGKITTKFGTPEEVLAHEIGHQLDGRYGLRSWLQDPAIAKELSDLADMRSSGRVSAAEQAYFRSDPERIANMVAGYLHAPELMKQVAPKAMAKFDALLKASPELRPLLDLKPSLELGQREQMMRLAGPMLTGHYYTPEPVQRLLDNHLSPGLWGNQVYQGIRQVGNTLNQMQLGYSLFHLGFEAMDTQTSAAALALQHLSRGRLIELAKQLPGAAIPLVSPFARYFEGSKMLKEYLKPGSIGGETADMVDALIQAGGRAKMDAFYKNNAISKFFDAYKSFGDRPLASTGSMLLRAMPALAEAVTRPVMEHIVPRIKMGVFADMARYELAKLPPDADVNARRAALGKAWDSVENRLGQLTYDNLFWNKTFKDSLMVGVRSVGWNLGTWRELGGGVKDIPGSIKGIGQGKGISQRTAYLIALPMVTAAYGALYQYLATGKGPDELKDYFAPKTGRTRPDGTPDRVELPSYMKDVMRLANRADEGPLRVLQNAGDMAGNKLHPLVGAVKEMLTNKDFYGAAIRNPNDSMVKQAMDTAKHAISVFEPFAVRAARQQSQVGSTGVQKYQGFIGITPAPSTVTHTWQQQRDAENKRKVEATPLQKLLKKK